MFCIVPSSQMEGHSEMILRCAMLHITPHHTNKIEPRTDGGCVLPRRAYGGEGGWGCAMLDIITQRGGRMGLVGVKRFHGVQRHSRRGPAAQMASEIEKRQKSNKKKYFFITYSTDKPARLIIRLLFGFFSNFQYLSDLSNSKKSSITSETAIMSNLPYLIPMHCKVWRNAPNISSKVIFP